MQSALNLEASLSMITILCCLVALWILTSPTCVSRLIQILLRFQRWIAWCKRVRSLLSSKISQSRLTQSSLKSEINQEDREYHNLQKSQDNQAASSNQVTFYLTNKKGFTAFLELNKIISHLPKLEINMLSKEARAWLTLKADWQQSWVAFFNRTFSLKD